MWIQREIILPSKSRGFHLITNEIMEHIPEIKTIEIGILHVFIKHTSASLTINENADQSVRIDFESHFNYLVPENQPYYTHTMEGPDDMPAHLKSSIFETHLLFLSKDLGVMIIKGFLKSLCICLRKAWK